MRTAVRSILITISLAALAAVPTAHADLLDDILNAATAARDRATEARNNAASARDRATEARNNAATARDNAAAARDVAITARDSAIEIRDNIRAGLDSVTAEMQTAIEEVVQDLQTTIANEVAGRDAFLQSGAAGPFRQKLVELFQRLETLANTLIEVLGIENRTIDYARFISLIQALPDRALYPLYRALSVEMHLFDDNGITARMQQAVTQLQTIAQVLDESNSRDSDGEFLDREHQSCEFVLENYQGLKELSKALTEFACELKFIGFILKVMGETEFQGTAGAVGCVGGTVRDNLPKKMGIGISDTGELILALNRAAGIKIRHCAMVQIEFDARARDLKILKLLGDPGTSPSP